jgi:ADP-L-glycero-D-manno-heptose 6-epimerase
VKCLIFEAMIVVTGAAGFIGSALLGKLQREGFGSLVAVDDFSISAKKVNFEGKKLLHLIHRNDFPSWLRNNPEHIQAILHIGARTDTSEFSDEVLTELNLNYSIELWKLCTEFSIPFIYASSAATYGDGSLGFADNISVLPKLQPLNPYGWSKHHFDLWVMQQKQTPPFWAGFKFFNVFGPNENHKGRMASVVFHAYNQIRETGGMKLFRSHKVNVADGEQQRDFIYVMDVVDVLLHFMEHRKNSGLYNLGTGVARSFKDLTLAVFSAMNLKPHIEYIDIPEDIRDKYQYFTQADTANLRSAGYLKPFTSMEDAVKDYVSQYLDKQSFY